MALHSIHKTLQPFGIPHKQSREDEAFYSRWIPIGSAVSPTAHCYDAV